MMEQDLGLEDRAQFEAHPGGSGGVSCIPASKGCEGKLLAMSFLELKSAAASSRSFLSPLPSSFLSPLPGSFLSPLPRSSPTDLHLTPIPFLNLA